NRDHHVEDARQDGPQQKLGVVQGRIGQHVLLDHERAGRKGRAGRSLRQGRDRRRDGRLERARSDIAGPEVWLVIEDDDPGPSAGGGRRAAASWSRAGGMKTAAIALPDRIACMASLRSEERLATVTPGAELIACTKVIDVCDRSRSTTSTRRFRITALLKVAA